MLRAMALVDQWNTVSAGLGDDWAGAQLQLRLARPETAARASALLAPLAPARSGESLTLFVSPRSGGVERALARLDREKIKGTLALLASTDAVAAPEPAVSPKLGEAWDTLLRTLPPDWSDLLVELELGSSDYVAPTSLLMTPLNARRTESGRPALRFRVARSAGYGAAPQMARRCLERCDQDGIGGELRLLRVLSGTLHAQTQGPVWQISGRTV